jgi:hypothetical protein
MTARQAPALTEELQAVIERHARVLDAAAEPRSAGDRGGEGGEGVAEDEETRRCPAQSPKAAA